MKSVLVLTKTFEDTSGKVKIGISIDLFTQKNQIALYKRYFITLKFYL